MKKTFCLFLTAVLLVITFSCLTFASTNNSWQSLYFNKLIEIREKPGLLKMLLTEKDNNGFYSQFICYALNDYNQDGIPELIVYGANMSAEAGDNYLVYSYDNGKLKQFETVSHKGPCGDTISPSEQPYWPYHTKFFRLPEGYKNVETNELIWIMINAPNDEEYWVTTGAPYEKETVLEVNFNFQKMTVDIVPLVYPEKVEPDVYKSNLQSWKKNHKLSIKRDKYGRRIPSENEELWKQLSKSDTVMPRLKLKNKLLILRNKPQTALAFWVGLVSIIVVVLIRIHLWN